MTRARSPAASPAAPAATPAAPVPAPPSAEDLDAYAEILVALARTGTRAGGGADGGVGASRAEILARYGLDDATWEALDDAWQARLSADTDAELPENEESASVPPLIAAFDAAMTRAQKRLEPAEAPVPLARFAEAMRELQRGVEITQALARARITMAEFMAANQYWTPRIVEDAEAAAEFRRIAG